MSSFLKRARHRGLGCLLLVTALCAASAVAQPAAKKVPEQPAPAAPSATAEAIYRDAKPRLLQIRTLVNTASQKSSTGSGFLISAEGLAITNYHVVREADEIIVRMSDRSEHAAKLIGSDQRSDVAVLKIDTDKDLPTITPGDSDKLEVGEWVLAIGSPFGFDYSVTAGIVSAKGRSLPNENYVPFIQTDVAINPGNSGGPLINLRGEVIGINSQIYSRSGGFMGISFAIPIDEAMRVSDQLRTNGRVIRGRIGVQIAPVTKEVAESIGLGKPSGALVQNAEAGGPADKAGIEAGDIITKVDGKTVEKSGDLPRMIGNTRPGTKTTLQVFRRGNTKDITVTVAEFEADKPLRRTGDAALRQQRVERHQQIHVEWWMVAPGGRLGGHGLMPLDKCF